MGGALSAYGLESIRTGKSLGKQLFFLEGLLPLEGDPVFLPAVKTDSGLSADIHIFSAEGGDWILLLDASVEEARERLVQQKSNELSLLRRKLSRIIDPGNALEAREEALKRLLDLRQGGDSRDVTVLSVHLGGSDSFNESSPPELILQRLEQYLRVVVNCMIDGGGILSRVFGDVVMTVFGVLPAADSPPYQAVTTAVTMLEALGRLNEQRRGENQEPLEFSIGIASGRVTLGLIESGSIETICATGYPVSLAAHLQYLAGSGKILIDEDTYQLIRDLQTRFTKTSPFADVVQFYSS